MILLLEVDYYNRTTGMVETLHLTTATHFSYQGKVYLPVLETGLDYQTFLYGRGSSGGVADSAVGSITIPNSDGRFDFLEKCSFGGRQFRAYWVEEEFPEDLQLYVTGAVKHSEFTILEVTLTTTDFLKVLDVELSGNKFLGTNTGMGILGGFEGGEDDLKGKTKPRLLGRCRNIEPALVNAFHLIYACNYDKDGNRAPVHSFWNVFGKGAEYLYEGDVATTELLMAAAVSAGYYKTCKAEGTFRVGTVPNGTVTCDVMESFGEDSSAARVIGRILDEFPSVAYDTTDLEALHQDFKCPVGIFVTTETTALDVIREIAASVDAWVVNDKSSSLRFGGNKIALDNPVHKLDFGKIIPGTLSRVNASDNTGNVPSYSVKLKHTKNWKVLDKGSLIEAIPEDLLGFSSLSQFFSEEWRYSTVTDETIRTADSSSATLEIETLLQAPVVAKLRNGSFLAELATDTPLDWYIAADSVGATVDVADGVCTVTKTGTYAYAKQDLGSPDEIYPGEYTLTFSVVSGTPHVILYHSGGVAYSGAPTVVDGKITMTFSFTSAPVTISIGTIGGPIQFTSVRLVESSKWGTPDQEATRRFNIRSVPEQRFKFSVDYRLAKDMNLGEQILFSLDRFGLDAGEVFLIIGKGYNFPMLDVELDIWRYTDGN